MEQKRNPEDYVKKSVVEEFDKDVKIIKVFIQVSLSTSISHGRGHHPNIIQNKIYSYIDSTLIDL